MKQLFKISPILYWILVLLGLAVACYQDNKLINPPKDEQILTEEDLLAKGYTHIFLWTLSDATRAPFELTNVLVEMSGPNSQWGTATPSFKLSYSVDEGTNWQDTILVLQKPPICIKHYAFYYKENQILNNKDKGTVVVYRKP